MPENSVVIFTRASQMLAEADTIQKTKELKDLALTAADWARRKNMGEEAIRFARSYALAAERKMGQMLKNKPPAFRAGPGRGKKGSRTRLPPFNGISTLADLGISINESSRAQVIADLTEEEYKKLAEDETTFAKIKKARNLAARRARALAETRQSPGNEAIIYRIDCLKLRDIPRMSLLITDPPYFTEGDFTAHVSKFLAYVRDAGQAYVFASADPAEIKAYLDMDRHGMSLQMLAWNYNNTGQRQPRDRYNSNYQVVLYFRGPDAPPLNRPSDGTHQYACQTVNAPDGRLGDRFYEWQKPIALVERYILNSSRPGDIIFDPFAGAGSILLAASKHGRDAYGCEIDKRAVDIAVERGCKNVGP